MTVVQIAGMAAVALSSPAPELARAAGWIAHLAVEGLIGSAALVDWLPWLTRRVRAAVVVGLSASITAALIGRTCAWVRADRGDAVRQF